MTDSLSQLDKWNLMCDLSSKQAEMLADRIWKGCMEETPNMKTTYESYCQSVRNNELSIANRFDEFNAEGKFTEGLPKSDFSDTDVRIYVDILITKTASNIVSSSFYTD
jgi:hypothetical protein